MFFGITLGCSSCVLILEYDWMEGMEDPPISHFVGTTWESEIHLPSKKTRKLIGLLGNRNSWLCYKSTGVIRNVRDLKLEPTKDIQKQVSNSLVVFFF